MGKLPDGFSIKKIGPAPRLNVIRGAAAQGTTSIELLRVLITALDLPKHQHDWLIPTLETAAYQFRSITSELE